MMSAQPIKGKRTDSSRNESKTGRDSKGVKLKQNGAKSEVIVLDSSDEDELPRFSTFSPSKKITKPLRLGPSKLVKHSLSKAIPTSSKPATKSSTSSSAPAQSNLRTTANTPTFQNGGGGSPARVAGASPINTRTPSTSGCVIPSLVGHVPTILNHSRAHHDRCVPSSETKGTSKPSSSNTVKSRSETVKNGTSTKSQSLSGKTVNPVLPAASTSRYVRKQLHTSAAVAGRSNTTERTQSSAKGPTSSSGGKERTTVPSKHSKDTGSIRSRNDSSIGSHRLSEVNNTSVPSLLTAKATLKVGDSLSVRSFSKNAAHAQCTEKGSMNVIHGSAANSARPHKATPLQNPTGLLGSECHPMIVHPSPKDTPTLGKHHGAIVHPSPKDTPTPGKHHGATVHPSPKDTPTPVKRHGAIVHPSPKDTPTPGKHHGAIVHPSPKDTPTPGKHQGAIVHPSPKDTPTPGKHHRAIVHPSPKDSPTLGKHHGAIVHPSPKDRPTPVKRHGAIVHPSPKDTPTLGKHHGAIVHPSPKDMPTPGKHQGAIVHPSPKDTPTPGKHHVVIVHPSPKDTPTPVKRHGAIVHPSPKDTPTPGKRHRIMVLGTPEDTPTPVKRHRIMVLATPEDTPTPVKRRRMIVSPSPKDTSLPHLKTVPHALQNTANGRSKKGLKEMPDVLTQLGGASKPSNNADFANRKQSGGTHSNKVSKPSGGKAGTQGTVSGPPLHLEHHVDTDESSSIASSFDTPVLSDTETQSSTSGVESLEASTTFGVTHQGSARKRFRKQLARKSTGGKLIKRYKLPNKSWLPLKDFGLEVTRIVMPHTPAASTTVTGTDQASEPQGMVSLHLQIKEEPLSPQPSSSETASTVDSRIASGHIALPDIATTQSSKPWSSDINTTADLGAVGTASGATNVTADLGAVGTASGATNVTAVSEAVGTASGATNVTVVSEAVGTASSAFSTVLPRKRKLVKTGIRRLSSSDSDTSSPPSPKRHKSSSPSPAQENTSMDTATPTSPQGHLCARVIPYVLKRKVHSSPNMHFHLQLDSCSSEVSDIEGELSSAITMETTTQGNTDDVKSSTSTKTSEPHALPETSNKNGESDSNNVTSQDVHKRTKKKKKKLYLRKIRRASSETPAPSLRMVVNDRTHKSSSLPPCLTPDSVDAGMDSPLRMSPQDKEYSWKLQDTITKLAGGSEIESLSLPRSETPAPVNEEGSPLRITVPLTKLTRVMRLPPSRPRPSLSYTPSVTTTRIGVFESKGVQVEQGIVIDSEVLDSYLTVKINEALYNLKGKLRATEEEVKKVLEEKERLEEAFHQKVQLIREITRTGFSPQLVEKATLTDSLVSAEAAVQTKRQKGPKHRHISTQTKTVTSPIPRCLASSSREDLTDYLHSQSPTPLSEAERETDNGPHGSMWLSNVINPDNCTRTIPVQPQVRLKRALGQGSCEESARTDWNSIDPKLCDLFMELRKLLFTLKHQLVEPVLAAKLSKLLEALSHLLSHIPFPNELVDQPTTEVTVVDSKLRKVIQTLQSLSEINATLPSYFKAEIVQATLIASSTLESVLGQDTTAQAPDVPLPKIPDLIASNISDLVSTGIVEPEYAVQTTAASNAKNTAPTTTTEAGCQSSSNPTDCPSEQARLTQLSERTAKQFAILQHVTNLLHKKIREIAGAMLRKKIPVPPRVSTLLSQVPVYPASSRNRLSQVPVYVASTRNHPVSSSSQVSTSVTPSIVQASTNSAQSHYQSTTPLTKDSQSTTQASSPNTLSSPSNTRSSNTLSSPSNTRSSNTLSSQSNTRSSNTLSSPSNTHSSNTLSSQSNIRSSNTLSSRSNTLSSPSSSTQRNDLQVSVQSLPPARSSSDLKLVPNHSQISSIPASSTSMSSSSTSMSASSTPVSASSTPVSASSTSMSASSTPVSASSTSVSSSYACSSQSLPPSASNGISSVIHMNAHDVLKAAEATITVSTNPVIISGTLCTKTTPPKQFTNISGLLHSTLPMTTTAAVRALTTPVPSVTPSPSWSLGHPRVSAPRPITSRGKQFQLPHILTPPRLPSPFSLPLVGSNCGLMVPPPSVLFQHSLQVAKQIIHATSTIPSVNLLTPSSGLGASAITHPSMTPTGPPGGANPKTTGHQQPSSFQQQNQHISGMPPSVTAMSNQQQLSSCVLLPPSQERQTQHSGRVAGTQPSVTPISNLQQLPSWVSIPLSQQRQTQQSSRVTVIQPSTTAISNQQQLSSCVSVQSSQRPQTQTQQSGRVPGTQHSVASISNQQQLSSCMSVPPSQERPSQHSGRVAGTQPSVASISNQQPLSSCVSVPPSQERQTQTQQCGGVAGTQPSVASISNLQQLPSCVSSVPPSQERQTQQSGRVAGTQPSVASISNQQLSQVISLKVTPSLLKDQTSISQPEVTTSLSTTNPHSEPLAPGTLDSTSSSAATNSLPMPKIQTRATDNGIVIKWTFDGEHLHKQHYVVKYELYACVGTRGTRIPPISEWGKVGEINPLPLPMQVTLTNFAKGQAYSFAVRARFRGGGVSAYSDSHTSFPI